MATLSAEALISKHYHHPPSFNQAILNFGSTSESHEELLKTQLAGHIPHQIHQRMRVRKNLGISNYLKAPWQFHYIAKVKNYNSRCTHVCKCPCLRVCLQNK